MDRELKDTPRVNTGTTGSKQRMARRAAPRILALACFVLVALSGCVHPDKPEPTGQILEGTLSGATGQVGQDLGEGLKDVTRSFELPVQPSSPLGTDYELDLKVDQVDTPPETLPLPEVPLCGAGVEGPCRTDPLPSNLKVPVKWEAKWTVTGESEYPESSTGTFKKVTNPSGLQAGFLFKPIFVDGGEWSPDLTKSAQRREVKLTLIFTADVPSLAPRLQQTQPIQYIVEQSIPVDLPEIGLPVLVAMFVDHEYDSPPDTGAYFLVRGSGTVGCTAIGDAFAEIDPAISTLRQFVNVAQFALIPALEKVRSALPADPTRTKCRAASSVPDLSKDPLNPGIILGIGNITPEDSITSMIVIGGPGTKVAFFNDRGFGDHSGRSTGDFDHNPRGGWLDLEPGPELAVMIPNLRGASEEHPVPKPDFTPQSATFTIRWEPRSHQGVFGYDSFNDEMSAMYFYGPGRRVCAKSAESYECFS